MSQPEELRERIKPFAFGINKLLRFLPRSEEARILEKQFLRSETSVAGKYRAQYPAQSKPEFVAKMETVIKEADETPFWVKFVTYTGVVAKTRLARASTLAHLKSEKYFITARRLELLLLLASLLLWQGCAYALPPAYPASQRRIRLVAPDPPRYSVRLDEGEKHIPGADGRVVIDVPGGRGTCSKYFLGVFKVQGSRLPKHKVIVEKEGEVVRSVPLKNLEKIPMDENSHQLLTIK